MAASPSTTRARRAPTAGTTEDAEVAPRAVKLTQMAAAALREWQADQAPEPEAAGSRGQDTRRVYTTATATPLGARAHPEDIPGRLPEGRVGRDWAPRDLRHTFVSLLSDDGMVIEKIARLVDHAARGSTWGVWARWPTGSPQFTLAYVRERTGHALIGARQWIPAEQLSDSVKSLVMGLPLDLAFRTEGQLAMDICTGAFADGITLDYVCGDEVYGSCTGLREFFEAHGRGMC
jgi:hypothetical protein